MSTVAEVINWTRKLALQDVTLPYLWEDEELIYCLNRCYNELVKSALLIKDQSTTAIMELNS